jgi:DNA modification methylase
MIEIPVCGGKERLAHPTQKPLALLDLLLERHAHKGDLVLDPFAGVASTLVAAKKRKLLAFGIELEQEYFDLGANRLRAL